jgi:hypothetical protein
VFFVVSAVGQGSPMDRPPSHHRPTPRLSATVLLILGVPERLVTQIMGWSSTAMAARYQHVTGGILGDVAQGV